LLAIFLETVGPKYYTRNYYCGRRGGPVTYQAGALVGLNVTFSKPAGYRILHH
jgi:hypothetical protein